MWRSIALLGIAVAGASAVIWAGRVSIPGRGSHCLSTFLKRASCNGLVRTSSAPCAKARPQALLWASAVKARIGILDEANPSSSSRMAAINAKPSIPGHVQVGQQQPVSPATPLPEGSGAVAGHLGRVADEFELPQQHLLVDFVVLGHQDQRALGSRLRHAGSGVLLLRPPVRDVPALVMRTQAGRIRNRLQQVGTAKGVPIDSHDPWRVRFRARVPST